MNLLLLATFILSLLSFCLIALTWAILMDLHPGFDFQFDEADNEWRE